MSAASVHVAQLQAKLLDKMVDARANILEFFQLICKIKAETWCSTTKKHNGTRVWVLSEQPCKLASQAKAPCHLWALVPFHLKGQAGRELRLKPKEAVRTPELVFIARPKHPVIFRIRSCFT
eukprot:1160939-Pelagomonas_calceolata.AAC.1